MKTKLMIKAQTMDMVICWSSGGMSHSAWLLNISAYASVENCKTEHSIPPSDQHIMSKV